MIVFVIKQYQPCADYHGEPVAVFDSYDKAFKQCKAMNDAYIYGAVVSENMYDFYVENSCCYDDIHCYTIKEFVLNRDVM